MKLQIEYLKKDVDKLQKLYGNLELKSIYGAGCISSPEILFLFMNPTAKNISALPNWKGIRAPWIGTKNIWKLFHALNILAYDTFCEIQENGCEIWTEEFAENIYDSLNKKSVYVTNLAKCTQDDARALKTLRADIFDYLEFLKTLPERTQNMLQKIEKGELGVKVDATELLGIKQEFDRQNDLRILGMALVAVFFATTILFYLEGRKTIGGFEVSNVAIILFSGLLVWFIIKVKNKPKK